LADPYCTDEAADDDLIPILLEPLPDPAPPESCANSEELSDYAAKQSKPANSPANICLPASFALKSSDDIVVNRKNFCQVHLHTPTVSLLLRAVLFSLHLPVVQIEE